MVVYKVLVLNSKKFTRTSFLLWALFAMLTACETKNKTENETPLFEPADAEKTGVNFVNKLQDTKQLNILDYLYYYNGAGVSAGDVNNDGLTDLFFVSNQGQNKLYLNQGNFQFKDVSVAAGIQGLSDWKTGVTMADVNGDGLLDIYVCAVGNYKGLKGKNELYLNNGISPDGQVTFTEKAADYGLDFTGFATQAAFFDYDRDGDLDVYLLNHAVHTSRSYDQVTTRGLFNNEAGDYLLENQLITAQGTLPADKPIKFKDVSKQAGIFQAAMGYGLGISIVDINHDGWDDIYVANDFHEDDYLYLNQGNGTFKESVKEYFRHVSRFSMGCDAADINNDGYPDIMTLDMYPQDEIVEKTSLGEDPYDIFLYKLQYGYHYQYSRNCLQLNMGGKKFSDIGLMAGVAATDWSWSTLLADYDNDGLKDIFISNGIVRRPNNLDYVKYTANDSVQFVMETSKAADQKAVSMMPEGKVHNYLFRGTKNMQFQDKSLTWGFSEPNISNGASYADLDNDGDLDLITNNINQPASIYRNKSDQLLKNNYLKVRLTGNKLNTFGLGAKVILKSKGTLLQMQQLSPTRGFMSSVEPVLTFGLGRLPSVDSLIVIWGDQRVEIKTNVKGNSTLVLNQAHASLDAKAIYPELFPQPKPTFQEVTAEYAVNYKHEENNYLDFYRESLMPFQVSTEGPKIAVGDVNGDGRDDFYVGGAKWQAGKLFVQQANSRFLASNQHIFSTDSTYEDVDAVFFDADNDKDLDLYVVSGGNEFYEKMPEQFDRLYLNDGSGNFSRSTHLPAMFDNKSCVRPGDVDQDGDLDLFVGGRVVGYQYGKSPNSYLLINNGQGRFRDETAKWAPTLRQAGMTTDAQWMDYDMDGDLDLLVVGDWMPVKIYENQKGKLAEVTKEAGLEKTKGLWQTIKSGDFDQDGDQDLLVGNLGTNNKFRKQENSTLKMYVKDVDDNGTVDHILTYSLHDEWYPVAAKDELGKQIPFINRKFTNYKDYAGKTIGEIFDKAQLQDAEELTIDTYQSVYLQNLGNKKFKQHALPWEAQVSKIFAFYVADLNQDGNLDALLGGNLYGVSSYQGRYDASFGLMLKGNGKGAFTAVLPTHCGFLPENQVRDIKYLKTATGEELMLVARNNLPLQVFKKLAKPANKAQLAHNKAVAKKVN